MSLRVVAAVVRGLAGGWGVGEPLEIVWHGGEPLMVGVTRFAELLEPFEVLRVAGRVRHLVQTGATLVTDQWCELFQRYDVSVGVSIDGPRAANRGRVNWSGRPMFDAILRGIEILRRHDVPFGVLAVISSDNIDRPHEVLDFIAGLGGNWVGLNVEARESANRLARTPGFEEAVRFWRDVAEWSHRHPDLAIRDLDSIMGYLAMPPEHRAADARYDLIPTISRNGDVVVLSPELLDVRDHAYGNFIVGNVLTEPLTEILRRALHRDYVREFAAGLESCRATCQFWEYCQGAHAGNRYFEHGTFTATETEHCRVSFQAPILGMLEFVNERKRANVFPAATTH